MNFRATYFRRAQSAFTMVEIAISLAVIGIALVAIIGVLPLGMREQRDNREQTVINQDATVFIEAIRGGARGLDDLTNYVYAITNYWTEFKNNLPTGNNGVNGYTYNNSSVTWSLPLNLSFNPITNGVRIVGLLSTPEYIDANSGAPIPNLLNGGISNHVVAYVRSISGPAVEKPPQDNPVIHGDSSNPAGDTFAYRILCVNAPVATDMNAPSLYTTNLTANLHELRLTFLWPILPNGGIGTGRQTFRALVAGQLVQDATNNSLYFYQSQSFTNAP